MNTLALLENRPNSRPTIVTDTDPVSGKFEGSNALNTGIPNETATRTAETCRPELISIPLEIPKPERALEKTEESEIQIDIEDAEIPMRTICEASVTPIRLP
jgi:hypothetical protein